MSELRKAAQQALEALEGDYRHAVRDDAIDALRAALAQPEQDLQLVANFLKEYGLEALEVIAALKTQPEPMLNGLTEEETNASASVMGLSRPKFEQEPVAWINEHGHIDRGLDAILEPTGWTPLYTQSPQHLQSFAQDWDAPGMEAYDDPPLAQPEQTRSQQMRDAGYTRRPRQLPKEDEPVAYQWLGTSVIRKRVPKTAEADAWQPLYTAPPQRKPLTDDLTRAVSQYNAWWVAEITKIINDNTDNDGICCADDLLAAIQAHGIGGQP